MPRTLIASYLVAALASFLVLRFHLLPAVFAGLAVHVLTVSLARRLPRSSSRVAHKVALGVIASLVVLLLLGLGVGLWAFLRGNGLSSLLASAGETLEGLRVMLPSEVADAMPMTLEDLREQLAQLLREHGKNVSVFGMHGIKVFAHLLLGMVIGGMTSLHHFDYEGDDAPFAKALHTRLRVLTDSFRKVVFAQLSISLINTGLTAVFLLALLPLFGVFLPMRTVVLAFTLLCGLLPVVGNLVSNTVIVLLGLGQSPQVGIASLLFLVAIHKLEYFTNAKIVGGRVHATAWELLCAMLLFEALFGLPGLIAAPVIYAWIKSELHVKGQV